MSTQTSPKIQKIINGLVANGVPRSQAVAVAMAIEHGLVSGDYAREYGTFLRDELAQFVEQVYTT
jgi:hypothetical protein